jgi:hypothetical protein
MLLGHNPFLAGTQLCESMVDLSDPKRIRNGVVQREGLLVQRPVTDTFSRVSERRALCMRKTCGHYRRSGKLPAKQRR